MHPARPSGGRWAAAGRGPSATTLCFAGFHAKRRLTQSPKLTISELKSFAMALDGVLSAQAEVMQRLDDDMLVAEREVDAASARVQAARNKQNRGNASVAVLRSGTRKG